MKTWYTIQYETFALDDEQHEFLWEALARASEIADTVSKLPKSALLVAICLDFLATNDWVLRGDRANFLNYIRKIENISGRRLVVIDPKSKKIEYGYEALEELAR